TRLAAVPGLTLAVERLHSGTLDARKPLTPGLTEKRGSRVTLRAARLRLDETDRSRRTLMATRFDAIIIGTGQSGPSLAERFAQAGKRVAVVERQHFGGTCVNVGCIPTKALVESAHVAHLARKAGTFGVDIGGGVSVDMKRIKARKDEFVLQSRHGVRRWME